MTRWLALALCGLPVLGHAEELDGFVTRDRLADPTHPVLLQGGAVWAGTCENCHGGNKLTGAPKITSSEAWAPRIATGLDSLFTHAIEGFIGPKYAQMPARGGNEDLSDDEVRAAVAFMVWASGGADLAQDWADTISNSQ
jgi:cytochrome c5